MQHAHAAESPTDEQGSGAYLQVSGVGRCAGFGAENLAGAGVQMQGQSCACAFDRDWRPSLCMHSWLQLSRMAFGRLHISGALRWGCT